MLSLRLLTNKTKHFNRLVRNSSSISKASNTKSSTFKKYSSINSLITARPDFTNRQYSVTKQKSSKEKNTTSGSNPVTEPKMQHTKTSSGVLQVNRFSFTSTSFNFACGFGVALVACYHKPGLPVNAKEKSKIAFESTKNLTTCVVSQGKSWLEKKKTSRNGYDSLDQENALSEQSNQDDETTVESYDNVDTDDNDGIVHRVSKQAKKMATRLSQKSATDKKRPTKQESNG